jgi:hypothetical protein
MTFDLDELGDFIVKVMITGAGCLSLVVLVCGTMYGLNTGKINEKIMGQVSALSIGSGILGLGLILFLTLRLGVSGKDKDERNQGKNKGDFKKRKSRGESRLDGDGDSKADIKITP